MTQAGPAIPVVAVTDRSADGGPALRVAVVTDGRLVEAGPARPVIVVSDGRPTQGNEPMPIVVASGAQAAGVLAGPAIPIVVVSGSLTPITDPFLDSFSAAKALGAVVGSLSPSGVLRGGTDTESKLSIDHGALRMQPMVTNGWNREGVSYPGYTRAAGLALVCRIIDGDVQTNLNAISQHLAVGWFTSANPTSALTNGNAIVFTQNGVNAGKLERNGSSQLLVSTPFKQNELYIVVVLRATGAAYYLGSVNGATDLPDYPNLRLVGVDTVTNAATVFPGIWQRALTSGANNSTRVAAINVGQIAAWANWYGSAFAADTLISGSGAIAGRTADGIGGAWTQQSGTLSVTNGSGAGGTVAGNNYATLAPGAVGGYFKMIVACGAATPDVKLLFRWADINNFWDFQADGGAVRIEKHVAGVYTAVGATGATHLVANHTFVLELIDNGTDMVFWLSDLTAGTQQQVPGTAVITDTDLTANTRAGIGQTGNTANTFLTQFEAHPRTVALPTLLDLGAPYETLGATTVYTENFSNNGNLAGQTTTTGSGLWAATLVNGTIINAGGKGVATAITNTTLDTLPWSSPSFADLQVDVLPPGAAYGLAQSCFSGVVFWQDVNNWLAARCFVDDSQTGNAEIEVHLNVAGSISAIRRVAFGTVIINHGLTTTLRATFDGDNFYVTATGVAAVCYSVTDAAAANAPLIINRVGLYVGQGDTGSSFDNFVAKSA